MFADSSALVKLYADESGAGLIRDFPSFVVSALARVEVPAALWRKYRMHEVTAGAVALLVAGFEDDYSGGNMSGTRLTPIAVTGPILDQAARCAGVHQLRAFDATQLASAMAARAADPGCTAFATYDNCLRAAAATEGFRLIPDEVD